MPYILVAPRDRLTVGRLAADIYRKQFTGLRAKVRARDLAALGHIIDAGASPARGELFSVLFFAREFVDALIELGREDAKRWLAATHDDGPWRYGAPPQPATLAAGRGRGRAKTAVSA